MKLHELKPVDGARHSKKRVGRGTGSGLGKTSGRGANGQNQRSGGGVRPAFEGGQTPLFKRIPKRGFTNMNRKEYAIVNIEALNAFEDGSKVTPEKLVNAGLVNKGSLKIKVLGNGKLEKNLTVCAHKFSKSATKGIEDAGGKIEVL